MSTGSSDERTLRRRAQCKTALGLLEAAAMLVNRVTIEAPAAGVVQPCRIITQHIEALQRTLVRAHDGER